MRKLPEVTLFLIDGGVALPLTRLALADTLAQIEPAKVIVFSANPGKWSARDYEIVEIPRCRSAVEAMHVFWYAVPWHIETSHMMHVEWDGWVIGADLWDDAYLDCDYIGAPWPWHAERKVGNGLGVRSTRLMRYLADNPGSYPLPEREDDGLCRIYRDDLEKAGLKWASLELATKFSWERGDYPGPTFMYHGVWNWPRLLSADDLEMRMEMATDYERGKPEWRELQAVMGGAK